MQIRNISLNCFFFRLITAHKRKILLQINTVRNAQKNGAQNDDLDNQLKAAALRKENMEIKKLELEIEQLQADIAKNNVHTNITHNIKENEKIYLA